MKRHGWLRSLSFVLLIGLNWVNAKDDEPKLEGVITQLDIRALTLTIADMNFWVDATTKIENSNSVHISFDSLKIGDFVELEYDLSRPNAENFIYASKIEQKR